MVRKERKTAAEEYGVLVDKLLVFLATRYVTREGEVAFEFRSHSAPYHEDDLYKITPHHIARYFEFIAYGEQSPPPTVFPTLCRAEGIWFVKKALSWHMPNKDLTWNRQTGQGNPTKSGIVNEVIAKIALFEVRQKGKKSNAKRDLKRSKFKKTLEILSRTCQNLNR